MVDEHRQGRRLINSLGGEARRIFKGLEDEVPEGGVVLPDGKHLAAVEFVLRVLEARFDEDARPPDAEPLSVLSVHVANCPVTPQEPQREQKEDHSTETSPNAVDSSNSHTAPAHLPGTHPIIHHPSIDRLEVESEWSWSGPTGSYNDLSYGDDTISINNPSI